MKTCPTCGEHLLSNGLMVFEGIGAREPRSHRCPPKWEALVGETVTARAWDEMAHTTYAFGEHEAVRKIITAWNEGEGEYPLGPRRDGRTVTIEVLLRRSDQPAEEQLFTVWAEPSIYYGIRKAPGREAGGAA